MRIALRIIQSMNCVVCEQSICSTDADDERFMARVDRALGAMPRVCPCCGRELQPNLTQAERTRIRLWAREHKK